MLEKEKIMKLKPPKEKSHKKNLTLLKVMMMILASIQKTKSKILKKKLPLRKTRSLKLKLKKAKISLRRERKPKKLKEAKKEKKVKTELQPKTEPLPKKELLPQAETKREQTLEPSHSFHQSFLPHHQVLEEMLLSQLREPNQDQPHQDSEEHDKF